jgi:hypothetical protein
MRAFISASSSTPFLKEKERSTAEGLIVPNSRLESRVHVVSEVAPSKELKGRRANNNQMRNKKPIVQKRFK